jgi:hypothetical protein
MMQKVPTREYTVELKEQAVKLVKDGKSVGAVAKEVGLVGQTLRKRVASSHLRNRCLSSICEQLQAGGLAHRHYPRMAQAPFRSDRIVALAHIGSAADCLHSMLLGDLRIDHAG